MFVGDYKYCNLAYDIVKEDGARVVEGALEPQLDPEVVVAVENHRSEC